MPPPTKAISDSTTVQRSAPSRNTNSGQSKSRLIATTPARPDARARTLPSRSRAAAGARRAPSQVHPGRHEVELERAERRRLQRVGDGRQFLGGNGGDDRRAEHQQHELAGERRIHSAQRGEDNDVAKDLQSRETQRVTRLDLAARHRFDSGADDLGRVAREVEAHPEQCRGDRLEADTDRRQREVDDEQLHQERRIADELDVGSDGGAHRTRPRCRRNASTSAIANPSANAPSDRRIVSHAPSSRRGRWSQTIPNWKTYFMKGCCGRDLLCCSAARNPHVRSRTLRLLALSWQMSAPRISPSSQRLSTVHRPHRGVPRRAPVPQNTGRSTSATSVYFL